jgi:phage FluMu protein Com
MALFRCNKCGHLREVSNNYIGKVIKCPKCDQPGAIYDTTLFVGKVLEKYGELNRELQQLQQQVNVEPEPDQPEEVESDGLLDLEVIDIHNTKALTEREQYEPILQWFKQYQINVDVNQRSIDTTGFFDEIALSLGDHYSLLRGLLDQIKYLQRKGYSNLKLNLAKNSQKEVKILTKFCRDLYEYSFVARYYYKKKDKIIRLNLQTAPTIVQFFNGEWMEWYVFMKVLEFTYEKESHLSCLRNLHVRFPNEDLHELDVFFLVDNRIPICVECKSGEFRQDIDKYVKIRKRLHIDKDNFLLCVTGLEEKQAQGLTSMYDLTFVNENNFIEHIGTLLQGS